MIENRQPTEKRRSVEIERSVLSNFKTVHFQLTSVGPSRITSTQILLVGFGVLRLWLSHEWFLRVPKFPSEVLEYFGSVVPHNGSSFFRRSFFSPETIFGSVVEELFRLAFVPFISILNELDRADYAFQISSAVSYWLSYIVALLSQQPIRKRRVQPMRVPRQYESFPKSWAWHSAIKRLLLVPKSGAILFDP